MEIHTTTENIAAVLQVALDGHGIAISSDTQIVLTIPKDDYQQRLGQLYQRACQLIERSFPQRSEDLKLLFRTCDGTLQHVFRLWRPQA